MTKHISTKEKARHRVLATALVLLFAMPLLTRSQTIVDTLPYCCDFEDSTERAQWQFANVRLNSWHIDTAISSGGQYSMYISTNFGINNYAHWYPCVSYAYRRIHIPSGLYDISFDWRYLPDNLNIPATTCYFRVFLIPDGTTFAADTLLRGLSNRTLPRGAISIDENSEFGSSTTWKRFVNAHLQVPRTGNYYLVFCYVRPQLSNIREYPPAVDNICITPVTCYPPQALSRRTLPNGCVKLSWNDYNLPRCTQWEVEYGPTGFPHGHGNTIFCNTDTVTVCGLLDDNIYDFYVRGICGSYDTTLYSEVLRMRYRDEQNLCLEFDDIKNPNVICTYGQYEFFMSYGDYYEGPYADTGVINYGPSHHGDSLTGMHGSRHTVHTDPNETDYRTGNRLRTVPPNECSSVRLGCVYGKRICQSISYKIHVDTSVADLLIAQYACVLQNPNGHSAERKPRFILEILDRYGIVTDSICLNYDFSGNDLLADTAWLYGIDSSTYWRDWTRAGVNLARYNGQTLTVRLTTFACGQGADDHFGYGYFNLRCYKSDIKVEVCGPDIATDMALFTAPPGFRYHWHTPADTSFSSTDQAIMVPLDRKLYYCDIFLGDSLCRFTKAVRASPDLVERKYIHAGFLYTTDSLSCNPRFSVINTSFSSNYDQTITAHDCDFFEWDFGDSTYSSDENPLTHYYPGFGPYVVSLIAGRTDIGCYDTIVDTISFFPGVLHTINASVCKDSGYMFGNERLNVGGTYRRIFPSDTACDTTVELRLKVRNPPEIQIIGQNIKCKVGIGTLTLITNGNDINWTSNPYDSTLASHQHDTSFVVPRKVPTIYTVVVDTFPRSFSCKAIATIMVDTPAYIQASYRMSPKVISEKNMQIKYSDYSLGYVFERQWTFHEIPDRFDDKEIPHSRFVYYTPHYESDSLHVRLIVRNESNCADTLQNTYPILKGEVWVPSVFTPDANENKVLKVGHHNINTYDINIYNRVGQRVFHSSDPDECWDGTYNGIPCPAAAYVYHINYTTKSLPESICEKNGSVLIVR